MQCGILDHFFLFFSACNTLEAALYYATTFNALEPAAYIINAMLQLVVCVMSAPGSMQFLLV